MGGGASLCRPHCTTYSISYNLPEPPGNAPPLPPPENALKVALLGRQVQAGHHHDALVLRQACYGCWPALQGSVLVPQLILQEGGKGGANPTPAHTACSPATQEQAALGPHPAHAHTHSILTSSSFILASLSFIRATAFSASGAAAAAGCVSGRAATAPALTPGPLPAAARCPCPVPALFTAGPRPAATLPLPAAAGPPPPVPTLTAPAPATTSTTAWIPNPGGMLGASGVRALPSTCCCCFPIPCCCCFPIPCCCCCASCSCCPSCRCCPSCSRTSCGGCPSCSRASGGGCRPNCCSCCTSCRWATCNCSGCWRPGCCERSALEGEPTPTPGGSSGGARLREEAGPPRRGAAWPVGRRDGRGAAEV